MTVGVDRAGEVGRAHLTRVPFGDLGAGMEQDRLAVERGGEDHPLGLDAHQLGGLEVRHHDHLLADQILRLVGERDAGDDRARRSLAEIGRRASSACSTSAPARRRGWSPP